MSNKFIIGGIIGVIAYFAWKDANTLYSADVPGDGGDDSVAATVENFVSNIMGTQTRGERNNNPGNLRKSNATWEGMSNEQTDSAFVQFTTPDYGIRALGKLLQNYYKAGYDTVRKIINRYAPSSENDTSSYVSHVSSLIGADPDQHIDLTDITTLQALVSAIITHENGRDIYADNGVLDNGLAMLA